MNNYGFTGKTISKKLDPNTIKNGGLETITMPIARCNFSDMGKKVEIGGFESIVHYNKDSENKSKLERQLKRTRSLKRQIKRQAGCRLYEDLPSFEMTITSTHAGELNS
ncbi:MAG TPA: hypothetical protein VFP25_01850 [Nitrososphaeraceae archaeon]|nr:hypothetical protein [Nitrososphaeraceae archaeon]